MTKKYGNLIKKFIGNITRRRDGWKKKLTKFLKFFYLLIMLLIEIIGDILFFWKRFKKQPIANPKKILIIKIDQFGDVLFSTFILPLIKKKWPNAIIDYIINPKTEFILKKNPQINKIYFWDDPFLYFLLGREGKRGRLSEALKNDLKALKTLKNEHYDVVINTRAYSPSSNVFWKLIKPKNLIAFEMSEQSFLADYWAHYNLQEEDWKNYLNLLKPLGVDVSKAGFSPRFYDFDDEGLKNKIPEALKNKKLVAVSPVSFDKERLWPKGDWSKVFEYLTKKDYTLVLTGLKSQEEYLKNLVSEGNYQNIIIATNLTIPEIGSLFRLSKFFIGIDSFPAHLALATQKQVICVVNEKIYYLKGYSPKIHFIDARSMIPLLKTVKILKIGDDSQKAIEFIKEVENR
ncbi:MAG: hypothetical protein M1334_03060 [Patescibacteria group bacterium]|nr:hypothetical protein [Patescibacteria group bacterium]